MLHTRDPSTWEAEERRLLQVKGQTETFSKSLSQKAKRNKNKQKNPRLSKPKDSS